MKSYAPTPENPGSVTTDTTYFDLSGELLSETEYRDDTEAINFLGEAIKFGLIESLHPSDPSYTGDIDMELSGDDGLWQRIRDSIACGRFDAIFNRMVKVGIGLPPPRQYKLLIAPLSASEISIMNDALPESPKAIAKRTEKLCNIANASGILDLEKLRAGDILTLFFTHRGGAAEPTKELDPLLELPAVAHGNNLKDQKPKVKKRSSSKVFEIKPLPTFLEPRRVLMLEADKSGTNPRDSETVFRVINDTNFVPGISRPQGAYIAGEVICLEDSNPITNFVNDRCVVKGQTPLIREYGNGRDDGTRTGDVVWAACLNDILTLQSREPSKRRAQMTAQHQ